MLYLCNAKEHNTHALKLREMILRWGRDGSVKNVLK